LICVTFVRELRNAEIDFTEKLNYVEINQHHKMIKLKITVVLLFVLIFQAYSQPTISFTFDDGSTEDMPGYTFERWNGMLLDHLDSTGIKSVFFVTGSNKKDDKGKFLLRSWNDRGHKLANHTYSHPNYSAKEITFERLRKEFLCND